MHPPTTLCSFPNRPSVPPRPWPPAPTILLAASMNLSALGTSRTWKRTVFALLRLARFPQHRPPCLSTYNIAWTEQNGTTSFKSQAARRALEASLPGTGMGLWARRAISSAPRETCDTVAETIPTQGDLRTNPALASIIHEEHLGMCSKYTGWGFVLSPSPLPLKTLVKSAPGGDTERRGVGVVAGSRAPTGRPAHSQGLPAAAAQPQNLPFPPRESCRPVLGLQFLPDRVPTDRPGVFHNS